MLDAGATQHWLVLELRQPADPARSVPQYASDSCAWTRPTRTATSVAPTLNAPRDEGLRDLWLKTQGTLQKYQLSASPLDVVGWDGSLYPFAFSIDAFKPKVGKVHLPPPAHATFEAQRRVDLQLRAAPARFSRASRALPVPALVGRRRRGAVLFARQLHVAARRRSRQHLAPSARHSPRPAPGRVRSQHRRQAHRRGRGHARLRRSRSPAARWPKASKTRTYHGSFVASAGSHSTG